MFRLTAIVFLSMLGAPDARAEVPAFGEIEIGAPAPDFTLTDLEGQATRLLELRGKVVVLEWFNPGCPFVVSAHEAGPLSDAATRWTDKGVVWLAINSGASGKQGTGIDNNRDAAARWSMKHPILLDEAGTVGRTYGARTTPQIVVIDKAGNQVYNGALDNAPMGRVKGDTHTLYVDRVLEAVTEGRASPHKRSKPYGCSVKYAG